MIKTLEDEMKGRGSSRVRIHLFKILIALNIMFFTFMTLQAQKGEQSYFVDVGIFFTEPSRL